MPSPFFTHGPRGLIRALLGTSQIADIDAGFLALATDVETKTLNYKSGLAAATGAAGTEGRVYRQTDTGLLVFDDGTSIRTVMLAGAWVPLTLASGITVPSGFYTPAARQVGDTVQLRGMMVNSTGSAIPGGPTWATIPSVLRPAETVWMPASTGGAGGEAVMVVLVPAGTMNASTVIADGLSLGLDGLSYSLT